MQTYSKERFEINILITEMMGINRVRKALRALSRIACTIDTSMDLLAADLLPVNKIKIHQMADEIRDKYVGYVEVDENFHKADMEKLIKELDEVLAEEPTVHQEDWIIITMTLKFIIAIG